MSQRKPRGGAAASKPASDAPDESAASAVGAPQRAAQSKLLADLGLHGLGHLDAPVLAALSTETPLLLIGAHGSAKSALAERLAAALRLEHRHYNASLISFDDLVGFPVPEGDGLRYLRTPATLWGAQSVLLDEISRCRPEVQNKLFAIVHERRLQGVLLDTLRYRWAAMNPPATDGADDLGSDIYLGSLPLDPALADRFGFVLQLPALDELSPAARRSVIAGGLRFDRDADAPALDLTGWIERCRAAAVLTSALHGDWITAYIAALIVPLRQAGLPISGRRASMLAGNIAAVHAALQTLRDDEPTAGRRTDAAPAADPSTQAAKEAASAALAGITDSALVALRHSLPHRAQGKRVDVGTLAVIHRQAVDVAARAGAETTLARILEEAHPVRRVGLALATLERDRNLVPRSTMSLLVCDALASLDTQPRWILSQELLPRIVELDCVDAATLELLAEPFTAQLEFELRSSLRHVLERKHAGTLRTLEATVEAFDQQEPGQVALGNLGAALLQRNPVALRPEQLSQQKMELRAHLEVDHVMAG
jgi:MoxR-like ATPase